MNITQAYNMTGSQRVNINWVFINISNSEFSYYSNLQEGENAAFIRAGENTTIRHYLKVGSHTLQDI